MTNPYKLLSKRIVDAFFTGSEVFSIGGNCMNGSCPAILDKGDEMVIIGHRMSIDEVNHLESFGQVGVYVEDGEVAIKIKKELFLKAIEEMECSATS